MNIWSKMVLARYYAKSFTHISWCSPHNSMGSSLLSFMFYG